MGMVKSWKHIEGLSDLVCNGVLVLGKLDLDEVVNNQAKIQLKRD